MQQGKLGKNKKQQPSLSLMVQVVQHTTTSLLTDLMEEAFQPNKDDAETAIQPVASSPPKDSLKERIQTCTTI
jgi:hypothetical protein